MIGVDTILLLLIFSNKYGYCNNVFHFALVNYFNNHNVSKLFYSVIAIRIFIYNNKYIPRISKFSTSIFLNKYFKEKFAKKRNIIYKDFLKSIEYKFTLNLLKKYHYLHTYHIYYASYFNV